MSWLYRRILRPVLFAQSAEVIHDRTLRALALASRYAPACGAVRAMFGVADLPITQFGLHFPNPVGLAAGMDKAAEAVPMWRSLGFGFSELGAVTWHPQPGNPRPRVFRAIPDAAIVNRMGFNNPGAEILAEELTHWHRSGRWPDHPVGINLGKSKITPLAEAAEDYARSFRVLEPHLDFFVVNVSSPNTPNLRQLQDRTALSEIFAALQEVQRQERLGTASAPKPILVKVAPDLSFDALDEILELTASRRIAGIIATNTTLSRPQRTDPKMTQIYAEQGGLSGAPLRARSTEVVRHLYRQSRGKMPIIGVGGIFTAADAWEKITAGASLVQVYTGMVFEGPGIARAIIRGLRQELARHGLKTLQEAVGIASE